MSIKAIFLLSRTINICTGIGLIVLGIFAIINILNVITIKFFLIPSPIFIAFFGVLLLGAEFKVKVILKNVPFLGSHLGRGIFNIYLSSVAFWFLADNEIPAWISAILLFVTGVLYIVFHCGWSKQLKEQYGLDKTIAQDQKYAKTPIRENFF